MFHFEKIPSQFKSQSKVKRRNESGWLVFVLVLPFSLGIILQVSFVENTLSSLGM